ncbi:AAA family ATPase [Kitasatospora sp. NPDC017646]|uniref:AAA family ATPase n=1 Tax=Kitasatospora sp. NPDC017646 TaxID=3364024 RepID=UPI0037998AAA
MADYFPYRIVTRRGDLTLIWRPGEGDARDVLLVDERGRLLAFEELAPLREHCDRNGWELVRDGEGTLDLDVVRRWVEHPGVVPVTAGSLLEAWNFFEDLYHSVKAGPPPPSRRPIHDSAYEKLFGGEALDPTAGEGAWTDEETTAVRELLRAGLALWEHAVRGPGTSTVVLMCGLPGAGKTTHAMELVRRGYVRLSIDEVVWQRLGRRDAGLVLEEEAYDRLKEEVRREQRRELVELVRAGRDVVVDYSFWSRAARDDYKALIEGHGGRWELIHLKADRATLERRLEIRNGEEGANSVTVNGPLFNRYLADFQAPDGEGEQVVVQHWNGGPVCRSV